MFSTTELAVKHNINTNCQLLSGGH